MKVHVHPADDGGCGHYRCIWPAEALQADGHDVDLPPGELAVVWQDTASGRTTGEAFALLTAGRVTSRVVGVVPPDCDVVVLQRPLQRELADVIPHLQAHGIAVVVEIDDDFAAIPPANVSFGSVHPRTNPDRNWQHLQRACGLADLVTCTTPALARRYGKHGRVRVLPNYVPASYLQVDRTPNVGVAVGWTGSVDTHPGDLETTGGAVARVVAQHPDSVFRVVGTGRGVRRRLGLHADVEACGWVEIDQYPHRIAELDVGIVPLQPSAFNQAKSALKMCEVAACGVPVVVSPTADNLRMHRAGVGMVAERPRQWEAILRLLVRTPAMRDELAAKGRAVMADHTIEGNAWRWWEAWADALKFRRGSVAA